MKMGKATTKNDGLPDYDGGIGLSTILDEEFE